MLLSAALFFSARPALAGSTSSGGMLVQSPRAISQSMGEAFVSISGDAGGVGALHYNPASTAFLKRSELYLMGRNGVADDTFGGAIFGQPTRFGTISGALTYYSVGDIDLVDSVGRARTVK